MQPKRGGYPVGPSPSNDPTSLSACTGISAQRWGGLSGRARCDSGQVFEASPETMKDADQQNTHRRLALTPCHRHVSAPQGGQRPRLGGTLDAVIALCVRSRSWQ
jgi:hypothetical protein